MSLKPTSPSRLCWPALPQELIHGVMCSVNAIVICSWSSEPLLPSEGELCFPEDREFLHDKNRGYPRLGVVRGQKPRWTASLPTHVTFLTLLRDAIHLPSTPSPAQQGSSPARCQPKFMVLVAGREDIHSEKRLTSMLAKSVSRWAASVMMARLCARYPPAQARSGG